MMKKQNLFVAYLMIGLGIYFLLKQLDLPIFTNFYSWPTILMIIGVAALLHSNSSKDHQNLLSGIIVLGFGIHFHGLSNYNYWVDHWAVYPFIIGIAFIIRFLRTKNGLFIGIILVGFSSLMLFSISIPSWFNWIYSITELFEKFWPIAIIVLGIYLLNKKR